MVVFVFAGVIFVVSAVTAVDLNVSVVVSWFVLSDVPLCNWLTQSSPAWHLAPSKWVPGAHDMCLATQPPAPKVRWQEKNL